MPDAMSEMVTEKMKLMTMTVTTMAEAMWKTMTNKITKTNTKMVIWDDGGYVARKVGVMRGDLAVISESLKIYVPKFWCQRAGGRVTK